MTGTFDDWRKTVKLENEDGIFKKTVELPKTHTQYKVRTAPVAVGDVQVIRLAIRPRDVEHDQGPVGGRRRRERRVERPAVADEELAEAARHVRPIHPAMAVVVVLLVIVFIGLLAYGHANLERNVGSEVAHGALAIAVATVVGCFLAVALYASTS